jgi:hypothetical protein
MKNRNIDIQVSPSENGEILIAEIIRHPLLMVSVALDISDPTLRIVDGGDISGFQSQRANCVHQSLRILWVGIRNPGPHR